MKRQNQLVSGGGLLFLIGFPAFVPPFFDRALDAEPTVEPAEPQ